VLRVPGALPFSCQLLSPGCPPVSFSRKRPPGFGPFWYADSPFPCTHVYRIFRDCYLALVAHPVFFDIDCLRALSVIVPGPEGFSPPHLFRFVKQKVSLFFSGEFFLLGLTALVASSLVLTRLPLFFLVRFDLGRGFAFKKVTLALPPASISVWTLFPIPTPKIQFGWFFFRHWLLKFSVPIARFFESFLSVLPVLSPLVYRITKH